MSLKHRVKVMLREAYARALFHTGLWALVDRAMPPRLTILAENQLDDGFDASPVVVGDDLYLRGRRFLYAVGR